MTKVDYTKVDVVEVGRKAYELQYTHGWNAYKYATKLAAEALAEGKADESEFWKAVEVALTLRE